METLVQFNDQLNGAPAGVLVFFGVIVIGYVLRVIAIFPNRFIPPAVIAASAFLFLLLAPDRGALPLRIWLGRNFLIGLIIGFVAWLAHNKGLKRIEDKIPFLKGWLDFGNQEEETNKPSKP